MDDSDIFTIFTTNVSVDETCDIVKEKCLKIPMLPFVRVFQLLRSLIYSTCFQWGDTFHEQTSWWRHDGFNSFRFYGVFLIWSHGKDELKLSLQYISGIHSSMNMETEESSFRYVSWISSLEMLLVSLVTLLRKYRYLCRTSVHRAHSICDTQRVSKMVLISSKLSLKAMVSWKTFSKPKAATITTTLNLSKVFAFHTLVLPLTELSKFFTATTSKSITTRTRKYTRSFLAQRQNAREPEARCTPYFI